MRVIRRLLFSDRSWLAFLFTQRDNNAAGAFTGNKCWRHNRQNNDKAANGKLSQTDSNMTIRATLALSLALLTGTVAADPTVLPMRERAELIDRWLEVRVQEVRQPVHCVG